MATRPVLPVPPAPTFPAPGVAASIQRAVTAAGDLHCSQGRVPCPVCTDANSAISQASPSASRTERERTALWTVHPRERTVGS
jgi:hypothetical protein